MTDTSQNDIAPGEFRIDVFSDPVCPWCLVGLTRLDNALKRSMATDSARILHHPFLLDADVPEEGQNAVLQGNGVVRRHRLPGEAAGGNRRDVP